MNNTKLILQKVEEASAKLHFLSESDLTKILEKTLSLLNQENPRLEAYLASLNFAPGAPHSPPQRHLFPFLKSPPERLFDKALSHYATMAALLDHYELDLYSSEEQLLSKVYKNLTRFPLA